MRKVNAIVVLISLLLLTKNLIRDLQLQQQRVGDLRNRIIGARLQKDGLSPYFYKWKKGEGVHYYDPLNDDNRQVSSCTASPFFHTLLYPLTELKYPVVSKIWIYILYGLLILTAFLAASLCKSQLLPLVCFVSVCFTFTETWLDTIVTKQSYLFIPSFAMLIYFFTKKGEKHKLLFIVVGIFSVALLLVKPNTILFFLPLIFITRKYKFSSRLYFSLPVLFGFIFTLSSPQSGFWRDYFNASKEHVKIHQEVHTPIQINDRGNFSDIEGFNVQGYQNNSTKWYHPYVEYGNFFVMIHLLSGYKIPPEKLFILCSIVILICTILFYSIQKRKNGDFSLQAIVIFGYCLYMISDIGTPVYRGHYNVIQWLFPLLLIPVSFQWRYSWIYSIILLALILNIHHKPFLPMQHVIAEYLWLGSFIIYACIYKPVIQNTFHHT